MNLKPQPRKQQLKLLLSGDYEIGIDGWGPDFADPITFLDLFTTDSAYNFDKYSNKEYDELIHKVKTDLAGDEKARWEAMKQAEKNSITRRCCRSFIPTRSFLLTTRIY